MDERELIAQLKQGSESAFGELYDRHWHSVCHFASLYLKLSDEIEDVVQEVFIKLWESRHTLRDDRDLDGFLFVVTRNLIFTRRRRSLNYSFYTLTIAGALSGDYDTSGPTELNDLTEWFEKLVNEMPAGRRQVFEMSRRRHMSYREISTELGITEKTVERHINEALKYLRAHLLAIRVGVVIFFATFLKSLWG